MAKAAIKGVPQVEPAPPVEVAIVQQCGNCRHWERRWAKANVATCTLSSKFLSAPAVTTDMAVCSQWEA